MLWIGTYHKNGFRALSSFSLYLQLLPAAFIHLYLSVSFSPQYSRKHPWLIVHDHVRTTTQLFFVKLETHLLSQVRNCIYGRLSWSSSISRLLPELPGISENAPSVSVIATYFVVSGALVAAPRVEFVLLQNSYCRMHLAESCYFLWASRWKTPLLLSDCVLRWIYGHLLLYCRSQSGFQYRWFNKLTLSSSRYFGYSLYVYCAFGY